MGILKACVLFLRAMLTPKVHLVVENLALRQQLAVLGQSIKRPRLRARDRVFWVWFSRLWPNPYCERIIGSIRRECLDHVIVLNERHLYHILTDYFDYYHNSRPHLSLDHNSPTPREVEPPSQGEVISLRQVGGLHHRYSRAA